jgi:GNAT superfamily N-acetyltransferase
MRRMEIVPFDATMVPAAAALLAARHRAQRALLPLLPERFGDAAAAIAAVEAAWAEPHTSGVAAMADGSLLGYLIGAWRVDAIRGRTAWVGMAGHALAADADAEIFRDLYAALAPAWITVGCFAHHILIAATNRALLEPWYALGFGQEQAHALRAVTADDAERAATDRDVTIRRAGPDDLDVLLDVADIVGRHQARAPTFAAFPPEMTDYWHGAWADILADEANRVLIAVRGGCALSFTLCSPAHEEIAGVLVPERCIELRLAAVRAAERGTGIGRLLAAHTLAAAYAAGYRACVADWRVPNLAASRFWPRQGFQPAFYRLARRIDERIIWAHEGGAEW